MTLRIKHPKGIKFLPKAMVFDTDNTLYPYQPAHIAANNAVITKGMNILGIKKNVFQNAINDAKIEIKSRLGNIASSHSRLLYYQRALELLGLRTQLLITLDLEQTYWSTFLRSAKLFPYSKELLFYIKSIGIKTCIITDLTAKIQFRKIIYFGLEEIFDYVVTSEESGKDKPSNESFELAIKKLGVKPHECWMVGDNLQADILGGRRHNMLTLQKHHAEVKTKEDDIIADLLFNDYEELLSFIIALHKDSIK